MAPSAWKLLDVFSNSTATFCWDDFIDCLTNAGVSSGIAFGATLGFIRQAPMTHPTCHIPFPPRSTGRYRKGMISARPSYQRVRRPGWDPKTLAPGGGTSHGAHRL